MRVAVVLAAGSSRRWGVGNKLLARHHGRPLLAHALAAARGAPVARRILVTGWQAERVARAARRIDRGATIVRAREYREGMGASLRAAAAALRPTERELLLFLGDMSAVTPRLAARVVRAARPGDALVRPAWRGTPGHPVLLRGRGVAALARATGDAGPGRGAGLCVRLVAASRACLADRDRPGRSRRA